MKTYAGIALLGLAVMTSCGDRNAIDACRELASIRSSDGRLLVKGQEMVDKVSAAYNKATLSESPLMRNLVSAVNQAKTSDESIKAFDALLAACADFHPVPPVKRSSR